jgi:aspartyl-tRNA synthetase
LRHLTKETTHKVGETVVLKGWVDTKRDHGKLTFIDLRDRSGLVQIVGGQELKNLHPEDVVEITGSVSNRPEATRNDKLTTGSIEIEAQAVTLLNQSRPLPFPLDTDGYDVDPEIRYKYRYVDLRRPRLQRNLRFRSQFVQLMREYLFGQAFTEIETPMLTKSTPEGSRDFVVPSRLYPGKFFALPQSPQQYKQLLMTAGFERYFQIARCLRDEDPRADRAYEHTQLDLEMSFVTPDEVMSTIEDMIVFALEKLGVRLAQTPFPRIPYQEALAKYGADKFDLRTEEEKQAGLLSFAWVTDFPFFEKTQDDHWTFTHNPFSAPIPEHEALAQKQRKHR